MQLNEGKAGTGPLSLQKDGPGAGHTMSFLAYSLSLKEHAHPSVQPCPAVPVVVQHSDTNYCSRPAVDPIVGASGQSDSITSLFFYGYNER